MIDDQNLNLDSEENSEGQENELSKPVFDEDILALLHDAQSQAEAQLHLPFPPVSETSQELNNDVSEIQNPAESWSLYYGIIEKLLKQHLTHEGAKVLIREQKSIFLKDGHEKGRDGRQGTTARMEEAIQIIKKWVLDTNGTDYPGLYEAFYNRNVELGYISKGGQKKGK